MNKIFKKIALPILIALFAIVLCFFGNIFVNKNNSQVAEAAGYATDATVDIAADKQTLLQGDEITFTITIHSDIAGVWRDAIFVLGEVDDEDKPVVDHMQYFSLVDYSCNFDCGVDFTRFLIYGEESRSGVTDIASEVGMYFQFADILRYNLDTTNDLIITCTLKFNGNVAAMDVGNLKFGVSYSSRNYLKIVQPGSTVSDPTTLRFRDITKNTVGIAVAN